MTFATKRNKSIADRDRRQARWSRGIYWMVVLLGLLPVNAAQAQNVTWEYNPYKIRVLLAVDPRAVISAQSTEQLLQQIEARAQVDGGATWRLR